MATTYEIVQGLAQAAANAYDGALDDKGELLKVGLNREEGRIMFDSRTMDGFGVKFEGNMLCIHYHGECSLKEVIQNDFEGEMEQRLADIASYLKKEYKKVNGGSVSLSPEGEVDVLVQNISRQRSMVQAQRYYKIGGTDAEPIVGEATEDKLAAGWEKFMSQGGLGTRPPNDKRPKGGS